MDFSLIKFGMRHAKFSQLKVNSSVAGFMSRYEDEVCSCELVHMPSTGSHSVYDVISLTNEM